MHSSQRICGGFVVVCDTHVYVSTDACAVLVCAHTRVCLGLWTLTIGIGHLPRSSDFLY